MKLRQILLGLMMVTVAYAEQPLLGVLEKIESNRYLTFSLNQKNYQCQPYGILTLDELLQESSLESRCKEVVTRLYRQDPRIRHFGQLSLKRFQQYHVEPKGARCTVYASGSRSYAQMLLREGLGMRKPLLFDELWLFRWKQAQKRARNEKLGLWKNKIWIECITGLYAGE